MANSVAHFSVYCDDGERAMAFYGGAFGWTFEPWGPPGFWRVFTGEGPGLTQGALSQRTGPRGEGTPNAFRCTITVPDLDAAMAAVSEHGGVVSQPVAEIPHVGRVVEFVDTEGNLACLMQYVEGNPLAVR